MNAIKILLLLSVTIPFHTAYSQSSANLLSREAQKHMSAGRYGEAITLLSELISQKPTMAEALNLRGTCYEARAQLQYAVLDFEAALKLKPENSAYEEDLNRARGKWQKNLVGKIESYKRELLINPKLSEHYFVIAQSYEELSNWEEAENWYGKYFDLSDASSDKIIRYSEILASNNQLKKGEQLLRRYRNRYPNDHKLISRHGYFLMWLGNYRQAVKAFERALQLKPYFKEAQDGLAQARGDNFTANSNQAGSNVFGDLKGQDRTADPQNKIRKYSRLLIVDPEDSETRKRLVYEYVNLKSFEQAIEHIQILQRNFQKEHRHDPEIDALKDSLYQILIADYSRKFQFHQTNRDAVLKLVTFYGELHAFDNSIDVMDTYFLHIPLNEDKELAFKYAQHAAWHGKFKKAQKVLDVLLAEEPDNLDYQLLSGQVLVWDGSESERAKEYLENVRGKDHKNIYALLTLSSLHIAAHELPKSKEYLDLARRMDPDNSDIELVQRYYSTAIKADEERKIFNILEEGRQLVQAGDCKKALEKYESYFAKTLDQEKAVLVEYAELHTCIKDLDKSITIYDDLLSKEYDYEIAVRRAKNYLWKGESELALTEFKKLSLERPAHFDAKLFCADAYLQLKEYSRAKAIYSDLLDEVSNPSQIEIVRSRNKYLPKTGLSNAFANFPRPIAFRPIANQYSDNQNFQINHFGGILNVGVANGVSGGASYLKLKVRSENEFRNFTAFKGRLLWRFSDHLGAGAGVGRLNSINMPGKTISDFNLTYQLNANFSASLYYENTDGALILYSPNLVKIRNDVKLVKATSSLETKSNLRISGYFTYFSISDGNAANDLLIRIGKKFWENTYFGYESQYQNYRFESPFLPGSNGTKRLYYSPQNQDSHSLWAEWTVKKSNNIEINLAAKIGYIPQIDVVVRKIQGSINLEPTGFLVLNGQISAGSSFRFDSSYNFFSGSISAYWRLY